MPINISRMGNSTRKVILICKNMRKYDNNKIQIYIM